MEAGTHATLYLFVGPTGFQMYVLFSIEIYDSENICMHVRGYTRMIKNLFRHIVDPNDMI